MTSPSDHMIQPQPLPPGVEDLLRNLFSPKRPPPYPWQLSSEIQDLLRNLLYPKPPPFPWQPLDPGVLDQLLGTIFPKPPPYPWQRSDMSGQGAPQPGPQVAATLITLLSLKEVAVTLPEGDPRNNATRQLDASITRFLEDICPSYPYVLLHVPPPLPHHALVSVMAELVGAAHSLQEGSLRQAILGVAGRIMQRSLGPSETSH